MKLVGANSQAAVSGGEELPGKSNYFIGNDPRKWRTNVSNYAQVKYQDVYPGIDLVYYGNQSGLLEYDFVVAPGADLSAIALDVGAGLLPAHGRPQGSPLHIDAKGDLVVKTDGGEVRFHKPVVYQEKSTVDSRELTVQDRQYLTTDNPKSKIQNPKLIAARYTLDAQNHVQFQVAPYDHTKPLFIDPVLVYSTFLGGSSDDHGYGIAVDSSGNAYVTGNAESTDFPTVNPIQSANNSHYYGTACVTKFNAAGSAVLYSTYLGGSNYDQGNGIAVDSSGNAYVTGYTASSDFPTVNPIQATNKGVSDNGENAFVSKLNATGSQLVYSTFLGGSVSDDATGIAVDSSGEAYVAGSTLSTDFPTVNPLQPANQNQDTCYSNAFVTKFNAAGSALLFSNCLGGGGDSAAAIAIDSSGNAYVTGSTFSSDFPTVNAFQAKFPATVNLPTAFVAKINTSTSTLVYSTYLGGSAQDYGAGIAVDSSGSAYVTGIAFSPDFPTMNPLQGMCGSCTVLGDTSNAFVTKFSPDGSTLVYSTFLGGSSNDLGTGIAVDSSGNAFVTGAAQSSNFPVANAVQGTLGGGQDAFATMVNAAGSSLVYSTYLGGYNTDSGQGIAVDSSGNAYVAGWTQSPNFPTINPLYYLSGNHDAFLTKISPGIVGPSVGLSPTSLTFVAQGVSSSSAPQTVTVNNSGYASLAFSNLAIGGTNPSDFAIASTATTCSTSSPVAAGGGQCTLRVTFTPTAAGSRSASLIFTDNASNSPQSVRLTGTGTAPVAGVAPLNLTFGSQNLGTSSTSQPVTLDNTMGTAALTIASISVSANFGESDNCNGSVAIGGSCTINVSFSPALTATPGTLNGTLTITDNSNGVAGSTQMVSLSGTATSSGGGGPSPVSATDNETITVTDTPLIVTTPALLTVTAPVAYYSVGSLGFQGRTGTLPLTVSNLGQANLLLVSVTSPASPFSIAAIECTNGATSLPTTLPAAGACVFSIAYVAPPSGTPTGTITFADNAALSNVTSTASGANFTQSIALSGVGTSTAPPTPPVTTVPVSVNEPITVSDTPLVVTMPALLTVTAPVAYYSVGSLGFGGQSQTLPLTVSNLGQANLSLGAVTSPASPFSIAQIACTNGAASLPTPLPAAGACIFSISYVAPPSGTPTGTLTFTDSAALSNLTSTAAAPNFIQTVPLNGAGTSTAPPSPPASTVSASVNETITVTDTETIAAVGPAVSLSPAPLTFAAEDVGVSSNAQTVTLTNTGNAPLTISGISASGDFSQTNTCGTSVRAGANCTISITFKPTTGGTRTGSLSISDNVPGTPQSVALSGTGLDFTFITSSGSTTSATVAPGQPAIFSLSTGGLGGLSGTMALSCTGNPTESSCSISPNPATLGSAPTAITVTVLTTAPSAGAPRSRPLPPAPPLSLGLRGLLVLALLLAATAWASRPGNDPGMGRWRFAILSLAAGFLLALALAGCGGGGGGGGGTPSNPGTPAGTYNLTVTGTTGSGSSALSHSVTFTLTVS